MINRNLFVQFLEDAEATLRYLSRIEPEARQQAFLDASQRWFVRYDVINSSGHTKRTPTEFPSVPAAVLSRLSHGQAALFAALGPLRLVKDTVEVLVNGRARHGLLCRPRPRFRRRVPDQFQRAPDAADWRFDARDPGGRRSLAV
jgi:hypothetical protein